MVRRILFGVLALMVICCAPVLAGRNGGGSLLVHTNDAIIYSPGTDYCATAMPASCDVLVTRTDRYDPDASIIWLVWAFREDDTNPGPEVTGLRLGVRTSLPAGNLETSAVCGTGALEVPTATPAYPDWPENGSGNAITWAQPNYSKVKAFYWLAWYGAQAGDYFGTTVDPRTASASFADNTNPPIEDRTNRFGTVKWGEAGSNTCPILPPTGACCVNLVGCSIKTESDCLSAFGNYVGDNMPCIPDPCGPCCYQGTFVKTCAYTSQARCTDPNYFAEGEWEHALPGTFCTGDISEKNTMWYCADTPTKATTWGFLRALFR